MSESLIFNIENLKCGGCANSIQKGLSSIDGVSQIQIDQEKQTVQVLAEASQREVIATKLRDLGYPERGTVSGLAEGLANVKSYVSCAIGRIT